MKSILRIEKLLLVLVFFLSGCVSSNITTENAEKEKSVLAGKLSTLQQGQGLLDGVDFYYPFLGLTMTLPEKWSLQLADGRNLTVAADGDQVVLNKPVNKRTNVLLHLKGSDNGLVAKPVLTLIAANFHQTRFSKRLSNKQVMSVFNSELQKSLGKSKVSYSFNRGNYTKSLGDVKYHILPADVNSAEKIFFQDYYSVFVKGTVVTFVLTYDNSSSLNQLEKVIQGTVIAALKNAKAV